MSNTTNLENLHEGHKLLYVEQVERSAVCELDGRTLFVQDGTDDAIMDDGIFCLTCDRHIATLELGVTSNDLTIIWV